MSAQPDYAYDVFLSYSEPDKDWVSDQLYPRLEAANAFNIRTLGLRRTRCNPTLTFYPYSQGPRA